ncbi:DUF551 domain-containing protein [Pantoea sp. BAV 3049]|uniref:DUF551 domain-containing protein n=1 Tax=Pantoea sp. BAV 3049 TaxID=2654188 RepID=UPI00131B3667|nr:DUF551 domain-containing protein [Pantoea sp. BAV 3049]
MTNEERLELIELAEHVTRTAPENTGLPALARIALASLQAEIHSYTFEDDPQPLYTAPPAPAQKWIKCSDELPQFEGEYIVYETLNNRVAHDYWMEPEPAEGFWNHYDTSVTHWMPLPAAPEPGGDHG